MHLPPTSTPPTSSSSHGPSRMSSDNIDENRTLTVSERRKQFENLAHEGISSTSSLPSSASTKAQGIEHTLSPVPNRSRALSTTNVLLENNASSNDRHLRQSSSNSDLKDSKRPVPPPPPPRTPKPKLLSPLASPKLKPETSSPNSALVPALQVDKQVLISRKPPPPPPTLSAHTDEPNGAEESLPSGNISVRDRIAAFGNPGPSHPSTRPPTSTTRIASQPCIIPPRPPENHCHQPRHSFSHPPPSPIIRLQPPPPALHNEHQSPTPSAPPLPARPSHRPYHDRASESHSRSGSSDSWTSSSETLDVDPSGSDRTADEGHQSSQTSVLPPPPRHPPKQPPRYPPRHAGSLPHEIVVSSPSSEASSTSSGSSTPTLQIPPPLPVRRSPPSTSRDLPPLRPPVRSKASSDCVAPTPAWDRKPVGHLPPPPTRTIALGEKPPAPRKPPSNEGSNSDSEDEDEPTATTGGRSVDLLPDSSNSSRRPPMLPSPAFRDVHPHVTAHSGLIVVAGSHVVVSHHHIKIFDFAVSTAPMYDIDLKDLPIEWRAKDPRVTSMEFRPAEIEAEHGRFLWLGGRDGTLWELDIYTGIVTSIRPAAHGNVVTHVLRYGSNMVTIDENGKALIFSPEADGFGNMLAHSQPRVARISDKQGFAKIIGGMLWTSGGPASGSSNSNQNGNNAAAARGPTIRVYDILHGTAVKSLLPLEHVGAVTSGTILQTHPSKAFLGHEGGIITVWDLTSDDGYPVCTEVVKVSTSDVLCLEGVYDRIWAGSRNGTVVAYHVDQKPWIMTNSWVAHDGPVNKLFVDPYSIEKCGQLTVVTVGRDEKARFWDGLLGLEWIEGELNKREASFSNFRDLNVLIVSWNVDAAKPDALVTGGPENGSFLTDVLNSVDSPDVIAFGFQELIDLESRKMAAKTVLLGNKKKSNGAISEKVSRSYKMWYDKLILAVRLAMPHDCPYTVVHAENLVGLFSCIFIKSSERSGLNDVAITTIKRGIGGMYGNKGAIVARLVIDDTSLCFINCHLAAGQHHVRSRNGDIAAILDEKEMFPFTASYDRVAYVGGGDGTMVMDHEIVFLNGDMNYRIDQRREAVISAIQTGQFEYLLAHDQLRKELTVNRGFRLRDFVEPSINFAPTYKYDRRSSEYDTSEKSRVPAWCDRVLYRCRQPSRVRDLHYRRYEANISDHRPISAAFRITVKSVDHATRARIKSEIEGLWWEQQQIMLSDIRSFLSQKFI